MSKQPIQSNDTRIITDDGEEVCLENTSVVLTDKGMRDFLKDMKNPKPLNEKLKKLLRTPVRIKDPIV